MVRVQSSNEVRTRIKRVINFTMMTVHIMPTENECYESESYCLKNKRKNKNFKVSKTVVTLYTSLWTINVFEYKSMNVSTKIADSRRMPHKNTYTHSCAGD